jgi:sugar phosphate isomerase/epimerase
MQTTMEVFLHTIALEPARWTPQRVSRPLLELLPRIAQSRFRKLEIFEPHLTMSGNEDRLSEAIREHGLEPVILSSYLRLAPDTGTASKVEQQTEELLRRVSRFGFKAVRLFPIAGTSGELERRARQLAASAPEVEFLFETHDGSLADDPERLVEFVKSLGQPNCGLLFQPTFFDPEGTAQQFELERHLIRHVHLQNRRPANRGEFASIQSGVIEWSAILKSLPPGVATSVEFVPAGICAPAEFDLERTFAEIEESAAWVERITAG